MATVTKEIKVDVKVEMKPVEVKTEKRVITLTMSENEAVMLKAIVGKVAARGFKELDKFVMSVYRQLEDKGIEYSSGNSLDNPYFDNSLVARS